MSLVDKMLISIFKSTLIPMTLLIGFRQFTIKQGRPLQVEELFSSLNVCTGSETSVGATLDIHLQLVECLI